MPPRTFDLRVDQITTENFAAIAANPETRWYAQRSLRRLAPALTAAGEWNPLLHPRGKDGKFLERFGWVRWLDKNFNWQEGWIQDIDPNTGELSVRSGGSTNKFPNAKNLYSRPKRKARLGLPNPVDGTVPDGWKKVGGQGGSNPGGMYQTVGGNANASPELGPRSNTVYSLMQMSAGQPLYGLFLKDKGLPAASFAGGSNVVSVPRLDGTKGRQDVLYRSGPDWYRVPASGSMLDADGVLRDDLKWAATDVFGEPNSERRKAVLDDQDALGTNLGEGFEVDDLAGLIQSTGSSLPDDGDKFYVKTMSIPERARNEAMANHLYEMLGVPVPEVAVGTDGKTISSKLIPGNVPFDPSNTAHIEAAQKGFIADALLANWDAVGMTYDNMQVDADGNVWRIDAGGALAYRAQGKPKGAMFGTTVGEMNSLRNPQINPQAALVYGGIPHADQVAQAEVLATIHPEDLLALAEEFELPEIGPILVARRQNILDAYHVTTFKAPEPEPVKAPEINLNPPPQGTGPQVAVDTYDQQFANLSTVTFGGVWNSNVSEANRAEWWKNAVIARGGDLHTYYGEYNHQPNTDNVSMLARNQMNGKVEKIYLSDQTPVLGELFRDDPGLDNLVDDLKVSRELAIAEIVDQSKGVPLNDIMADTKMFVGDDSVDSGTMALHHFQVGIPNWQTLMAGRERNYYGPENAWALRDGYGQLWEITTFPEDDGDDLVLQWISPSGKASTWTLNKESFANSNWFRAGNDTTAAIWKSKIPETAAKPNPDDVDVSHLSPDDQKWYQQMSATDVDKPEPIEADPADAPSQVFVKTDPTTWKYASDEEFNEAFPDSTVATQIQNDVDPELEKVIAEEEAIAQAVANAAPTVEIKTNGTIVDALGPGEPIMSTEWLPGDIDQITADLMGKNVVVLPLGALDNPDWDGQMGIANGLGTVVEVKLNNEWVGGYDSTGKYNSGWEDVVKVRVQLPSGQFTTIIGGDSGKNPKVVFPVEMTPVPMTPTFKKTGEIVINGTVVGTWHAPYTGPYEDQGYYYYRGVIDADHSITGKPVKFQTNKKKNMKAGPASLVVPIAPKPTKAKSTKVYMTEQEIKDLNAQLVNVQADIAATTDLIANPTQTPVGEGVPLADGSYPQIGDWVMSTKDGKYGKVVELSPNIGPAYSAAVAANYIKLNFQDPATGKWKKSNRTLPTLVAVAGPGEPPFVMETKALQDVSGDWYGPGMEVYAAGAVGGATDVGDFSNQLVLDTTTDGKVKLKHADGTVHWTTSKKVFAPGKAAEEEGAVLPTIKKLPTGASAEELNAHLAALNDTHTLIAAQIANSTSKKPKAKKAVGTPYPGPNGKTVNQPAYYAEQRTAKGLNNYKDGYAPSVGQILRHNDGTQYVVAEVGLEYTSHKNSVRVYPLGDAYNSKWRAVTTMVVDHETTLTDGFGNPLPIINQVEGADWSPTSGVLWRQDTEESYYHKNPLTLKTEWRTKPVSKFYVVSGEGAVYNIDGTKVQSWNVSSTLANSVRVGYIDKDDNSAGAMKLTVSIQQHDKIGAVQYAVIHDPADSAGVILTKPKVEGPKPDLGVYDKVKEMYTIITQEEYDASPTTYTILPNQEHTQTAAQWKAAHGVQPVVPPVAEPAQAPEVALPEPSELPTAPDLPVFAGANPQGTEVPHPAVTTSSVGVPSYKATGGTNLDVAGIGGARSVMGALAETIDTAKANKQTGEKTWISTYGLADHDVIEDMMVQTQVVRDSAGKEFVEVRFRVDTEAARTNHATFITSSTNQSGDWDFNDRNAKNLVAGDLIAVRVSGGGGVTVSGALRPDGGAGEGKTPNATVTGPPTLIGKNKAGTYDVWRTPVVTANGDEGWIDLEDRDGADTIATAFWDPTKPRTTNGNKSLNPNAQADGWSVKTTSLGWERSDYQDGKDERYDDAVKKLGNGSNTTTVGQGWVLNRDYDGANIQYQTSSGRNSNDGKVVIRVPVDDPEAQRKISEAMELVGVSKEAQAPPDKAALQKMATNKVWAQFNPIYTKGKKPNSPQEALTAIDNAVGAQLGRKATMDDISLRVFDDGRVQVLVSEDVSRAIVAKNGVKAYTHHFSSQGMKKTIEGAMTQEHPGLMATTERWQHGMFYNGMSSVADHGHDSADHLFLRMSKDNTSSSQGTLIMDPVMIHRQVDYYWQPHDTYGERPHAHNSDQLNWLTPGSLQSGNELMIKRRLEATLWGHVILTASERQEYIDRLHKEGVTHAPNGMLLEDFFVTTGGAAALPKDAPSFGQEIPLTALPENFPGAI